ncbi:MAG: hypothetical protein ACRYGP_26570 [Janthinobacterium lividum]
MMRRDVEIHQAVHGYSEGHTLLSSSLRLGKKDARLMLVLSDLAGSGGSVGENGYLSGYPLPESGRYVLAKTWLAPEMRRPGCVWTHSLIVEPKHLDSISRRASSDDLFVRPEVGRYDGFKSPIARAEGHDDYASTPFIQEALGRAVISALYTYPTKSVFFADEDEAATDTVVGIWDQQWLALKARFRFCTSVAADRSIDGMPFDLQVARKGTRNPASIFKTSLDVRKLRVTRSPWLDAAVGDLTSVRHDLAQFLRDCGPMSVVGREAFVPATTLFCFLHGFSAVAEQEAMAILEHPTVAAALPDQTKLCVIKQAALGTEDASPETVAAFLKRINHFDGTDLEEAASRLGRRLVQTDLRQLLVMTEGSRNESRFASTVIGLASAFDLVNAAIGDLQMSGKLLRYRADLLEYPEFIATFTDIRQLLEIIEQTDASIKTSIITALVRGGSRNLDALMLRRVDAAQFWVAVESALRSPDENERANAISMIHHVANDIVAITGDLAAKRITSAKALDVVCRATRPDQILNDYGSDPWLVALSNWSDDESVSHQLYIMAYTLCRGLGWRSRQPVDLVSLSFRPVYDAAKRGNLPTDIWKMLDDKLRDSYISSWDMCKRLRRTVAELFVNRHGAPSQYMDLLPNDDDFFALLKETEDRYGGRSFLKEVRHHLREDDNADRKKLKLVERVLD